MAVTQNKKQRGFTLIELVMTIVIFSIMSAMLGQLLMSSYKTFTNGNAISTMSAQALLGVERMVYDLHNASSITTIAANSFTFADQTGTSYTYALSGAALQRASYNLVDSVQGITFTYLDLNGNVTAAPAAVAYVKINLSLLNNGIPLNYTTSVYLNGLN